jgi:hypothetical protein
MLAGCAEDNESAVSSGTVQPTAPAGGAAPSNSMSDFGKQMQTKSGMGGGYPGAPKAKAAEKAAEKPAEGAPTK